MVVSVISAVWTFVFSFMVIATGMAFTYPSGAASSSMIYRERGSRFNISACPPEVVWSEYTSFPVKPSAEIVFFLAAVFPTVSTFWVSNGSFGVFSPVTQVLLIR